MKFVSQNENTFEFIGRTQANNGVQGYVEKLNSEPNEKKTLSVSQIGSVHSQLRANAWYSSQNMFVLIPNNSRAYNLFMVSAIDRTLQGYEGYANYPTLTSLKEHIIQLPQKNGEIDFEFMESFVAELNAQRVAELNAYLSVTGLKDYELTEEEKESIERYNLEDIEIQNYMFSQVFNKIKQGRRLKKEDQKEGDIPFVMSGVTNMGVVGYVSNPVACFKRNSITIDIFGNAFYRNYDFGAGDDTGVYWSDKEHYSENAMLFFTTAMGKALNGKYSYGKKLRSSQSLELNMKLPTSNNDIDIKYVEVFISAIKKLVIKEVVLWADKKIETTKQVANGN